MLVLTAAALLVVYAGLTPWALRIGGRRTLDRRWDGFGQVAASNGGRYLLYVRLQGGKVGSTGRGAVGPRPDNLHGSAELCTESGAIHTFQLKGTVEAWWTTDGAPTWIHLTGGEPVPLQPGREVTWHGTWHGPALELDSPDNSFTKAFTPRGEIRRHTSSEDAGTARAVLMYGGHDDFTAACRALQPSSG